MNKSSFSLAMFVHEFNKTIGHSRAMIECMHHFDWDRIDCFTVICFEHDPIEELFPDHIDKIKIIRLPKLLESPFLIKAIWFHLLSFFILSFKLSREVKVISMGTASLWADISYVQFIHDQWAPQFFKLQKMNLLSWAYKKILFCYFSWNERFLFSKKKGEIIVLAEFMKDYIVERFNKSSDQVELVRSSVNWDEFSLYSFESQSSIDDIIQRYPVLSTFDFSRPIILFVGAFERKGLPEVLTKIGDREDLQLLIIGEGGLGEREFSDLKIKTAHIPFTKEISLFYSLSDAFVFPTHYEPFGLVIFEAFAAGLPLYVTKREVGASELLDNFEEVHLFERPCDFSLGEVEKLDFNKREALRAQRLSSMSERGWKRSGEKFFSVIEKLL